MKKPKPREVKQGRPFGGVPGERITRCSVGLRQSDIKALGKYGNGNLSAGIRRLIDNHLD